MQNPTLPYFTCLFILKCIQACSHLPAKIQARRSSLLCLCFPSHPASLHSWDCISLNMPIDQKH